LSTQPFPVQSINFFCKRCAALGRYPVSMLITNITDQATAEAFARGCGWQLSDAGWLCPACIGCESQPKHTPGPWLVDTMQNAGRNWLIADCGVERKDNQHYIVTTDHVHASEIIHGGALNDARLMAAAPDLLAALINHAKSHHEQHNTYYGNKRNLGRDLKFDECDAPLCVEARAAILKATGGAS
jgi:hypothetical protein